MRKSGLAQYLKNGKRADSKLERHQKDNVVPLYGSLELLKKAEDYCNSKKNWNNNYEHITISFSDEDIEILDKLNEVEYQAALIDISTEMIKHRTSGYDLNHEVIAYSELHDPKVKKELNARTGVLQKRRKHIHIGISYLNPLSDTKLQTTFYNNSYISDTIDKYIAKKHGLTFVPQKAPSDSTVDAPSQMTINRNILKEATKDFTTKKELLEYLDLNGIKYGYTNIKSKTKQSNIYVFNNKGGKIHLRGKDFPNIEIMHNNTLSDKTKVSYIKELNTKTLQELGDILEAYYKTNRIPIIDKRRSQKTKQLLNDIYEQSHNDIMNDKVNSFSSLQAKIFYKHYKHLVTTNLQGYFVDTKKEDEVKFINKKKNIEVTDLGDKIVSNTKVSNENLEEEVKLMLDIAVAKGWDLSTLNVNGDDAFKKESYKQIAELINQKKEVLLETKKVIRPKTVVEHLQKENQEKREEEETPLKKLKEELSAQKVLDYAIDVYKLNIDDYEVTKDNKINNKTNRQKPKNVIDFFKKEVNFTTAEAIAQCQVLFKNEPLAAETKKEDTVQKEETKQVAKTRTKIKDRTGDLKMPLHISINKSGQRNALSGWEVVEVKRYSQLSTFMQQHAYSAARFDKKRDANNVSSFNNVLIFDVDNDPNDRQMSMVEAKALLESKGVSAMLLPSKNHKKEKFTNSGKSKGIKERYRIVIPTKSAIRNDTDKETYKAFQHLVAKELGLFGVVDTSALSDKARYYYASPLSAVPIVIDKNSSGKKIEKVFDTTDIENKAIENVQAVRAEKEAQRIKLEQIKANIDLYRVSSKPKSNYLTYVDTEAIMELPMDLLIQEYEEGVLSEEGSYRYMKTEATKYSIIDNKLAHDFKNNVTYNPVTYLLMYHSKYDIGMVARSLKLTLGKDYVKLNVEGIKIAVQEALKDAKNDREFEESIKSYFSTEYCKLYKDTLVIANETINLREIGLEKIDIINSFVEKREKIKLKNEEGEDEGEGEHYRRGPSMSM